MLSRTDVPCRRPGAVEFDLQLNLVSHTDEACQAGFGQIKRRKLQRRRRDPNNGRVSERRDDVPRDFLGDTVQRADRPY